MRKIKMIHTTNSVLCAVCTDGTAWMWLHNQMQWERMPDIPDDQSAEQRAELLARPIDTLALSTRAYNALKNNDCENIGDVTKLNAYNLLCLPNFGRTSLKEVQRELASMNLSLASRP